MFCFYPLSHSRYICGFACPLVKKAFQLLILPSTCLGELTPVNTAHSSSHFAAQHTYSKLCLPLVCSYFADSCNYHSCMCCGSCNVLLLPTTSLSVFLHHVSFHKLCSDTRVKLCLTLFTCNWPAVLASGTFIQHRWALCPPALGHSKHLIYANPR